MSIIINGNPLQQNKFNKLTSEVTVKIKCKKFVVSMFL